jgi:hypothetical protein
MIDRFGRTVSIVDNGNGIKSYTVNGVTITSDKGDVSAIYSLNGMAPEGWSDEPPNTKVTPYDFLNLFTEPEKTVILSSSDIVIKKAITKLTAIITYVDVTDQETIDLVGYLSYSGLITSERASQILSRQAPS